MAGWVKLHRKLKDWEWYDDINATRLLIHLLVSVNYEDKYWKGITIKAGSMVLSWATLSHGCKLSVQQCRTAMTKLKSSKEVTINPTNKYQVVTLLKWDKFQLTDDDANKQLNIQVTSNQQTSNKQVTTTKEYNNYKNNRIEEVNIIFDNILMSEIEISDVDKKLQYYFRISEKFRLLFIKNLEEKKSPIKNQKNATFKNYVNPIRLMFERDEITREQLLKVYDFLNCNKSEDKKFSWKANILSTSKLREKFQTISVKANLKENQPTKEYKGNR